MKPLRRTNRATVQWITRLFLGYAKDYHIAHRAFQGAPLTTAEQSRWSVQMILHQFRATERQSDEGGDRDTEPFSYWKHADIVPSFKSILRQEGYDESVISDMIESHVDISKARDILRSPVSHYILAPLASIVNAQQDDDSIKNTIYFGTIIALMELPDYRLVFHRLMGTMRERIVYADSRYCSVSVDRIREYAKILLIAMIQETNTRVKYQENVPYEWQHHRFVAALDSVIAEHHNMIQQVLYTAGMSDRHVPRKAYHHLLSDGLLTVARLERDMKKSKNT